MATRVAMWVVMLAFALACGDAAKPAARPQPQPDPNWRPRVITVDRQDAAPPIKTWRQRQRTEYTDEQCQFCDSGTR